MLSDDSSVTPSGETAIGVGGQSQSTKRENKTCDNCRKRKVKCVLPQDSKPGDKECQPCRNIDLPCTYDYIKKKPGRTSALVAAYRSQRQPNQSDQLSSSSDFGQSRKRSRSPGNQHSMRSQHPHPHPHPQGPQQQQQQQQPPPPPPPPHEYRSFDESLSFITGHGQGQGFSPNALSTPSDNRTISGIPVSSGIGVAATATGGAGGAATTTTTTTTTGGFQSGIPINTFNPSGGSTAAWLDSLLGDGNGSGVGGGGGSGGGGFPIGEDLMEGMDFSSIHPRGSEGFQMGFGGGIGGTPGRTSFGPYSDTLGPSPTAGGGGLPNLTATSTFPPGLTQSSDSPDWPLKPSAANKKMPQVEDVVSWSDLCYFISLFLKYLYPLMPIVHRPTFAENLATRLDIRDPSFRALLLSIVVYVISQLPTSRMSGTFDIEGLKRLQRRCHRTCLSLESFYLENVTLVHVATIMFDYFYLISIGLNQAAGVRLGIAAQLTYSMGLHSDAKTATLGLDPIEIQLRRRTFWHLYAMDKTRAIPGLPMLLNDFQGVCSFPEETDDEFITSQGTFAQPPSRVSYLVGFVSVCKVFRVLSETFFVHRTLHSPCGPRPAVTTAWAVQAEDRVHAIVDELPNVMQGNSGDIPGWSDSARQVFAMERANVLITAAIAKFALYDLRASLDVDKEQLAREREDVARDVYSLLISIPTEDLAANGESMRTKVLHIACALCARVPPNRADQELVKNWWDMFSVISFTQMPAVDSAVSSRSGSPMTSRKKGG